MPTRRRSATLAFCVLAGMALAGGCTGGGGSTATKATSTTVPAPLPNPQPTPRPHLSVAVGELLDAEKRSDRAASFPLLARSTRVELKDVADWAKRRQQLPPVTGFRVNPASEGTAGDKAGKVVVVVEHAPALDSFRGLAFARESQTFTGERSGTGWLVVGEPEIQPEVPPEAKAVEAATAWVAAVQACDKERAASLQAVTTIFGTAAGAGGLCGKAGAITPGPVGRLSPGLASTDIVGQYSTDALDWARVVRITAPTAFGVVLAPIADGWKVLGVTE